MIRWELIDRGRVPGEGKDLLLYRRGEEYAIRVDGVELMNSRVHASEEALAELACPRIAGRSRPRILIGGLGMGFTTAAALRHAGAGARLIVAEVVPAVVAWNRGPLAHLAGRPLEDPRVKVREIDVAVILRAGREAYDAILLDVDNGPAGLTRADNDWLYAPAGLRASYAALRPGGVLAIWSVAPEPGFSRRLRREGFAVEEISARARGSGAGGQRTIWLAERPAAPASRRR